MTTVLALDLATSTGFAISQDGAVESGVWDLRRHGSSVGERLFGFQTELAALLSDGGPAEHRVVVFETPWVGQKTHQQTARLLMSLAGVAEMVAWEAGAACYEVTAPTWRKHFLGKGRGSGKKGTRRADLKRLAVERCVQLGYVPKTSDEAEALGILDYALASLKAKSLTGAGPLFQGRAA